MIVLPAIAPPFSSSAAKESVFPLANVLLTFFLTPCVQIQNNKTPFDERQCFEPFSPAAPFVIIAVATNSGRSIITSWQSYFWSFNYHYQNRGSLT